MSRIGRFFLWAGLAMMLAMTLAPVTLANGVYVVGFGRFGSLALRSGLPIMAVNDVSSNSLQIVRCHDAMCSSKTVTTADNTSSNMGQYPSMVLGPDGFPVVAYYDAANKRPRLLDCSNVDCTTFVVRKDLANISVTDLGQYMNLALTPDGVATVAYYDATNLAVEVVRCDTTSCATPTRTRVEAGNVGEYVSMKIAADQTPVLAYYNRNTKSLRLADCTNSTCSTKTFTTIDDGADPADVGQWVSLGIGADGFPVIAYYDAHNKDLKVADCADSACVTKTITVVDSVGDVGTHTRLVVRPNGRPLIAYRDNTNNAVKLADCEDFSCTNHIITTIDSSGGGIGGWPSVAIRTDGTPVLSYSTITGPPLYLHDTGNQAPLLTGATAYAAVPDAPLTFTLNGSDSDNRPVQTLTYAMYGQVPPSASLNPVTGLFAWTPTLSDLGTHTLVFEVTDNGTPAKNAYLTVIITVAEDIPVNPAPVLTLPPSVVLVAGETASFTVGVSDDDTPVTLSAAPLPAGATFDSSMGVFTWPSALGQAGSYAVTFTAIDSGTPTATSTQVVSFIVHDQLVVNGDFEADADANAIPDGWKRSKPSGDARVCGGVGLDSPCAYQITGGKTEKSTLQQGLDVRWIDIGDTVTLEAGLKGTSVPKPFAVVKLKIVYANGTTKQLKATVAKGTGAAYDFRVSQPLTVAMPIRKMAVLLTYRRPRGKVLIDAVRVIVVDGGLDPTRGLLPLP